MGSIGRRDRNSRTLKWHDHVAPFMGRASVRDIAERHAAGEPLTMLTAYDATMARLVDTGGVDMILVGDSAGDNHLGYDDTIPVTLEEALSNTAAVDRTVEEAMVIADLPFLSYGTSIAESVRNAGRFMKEAGADAVKLESSPGGEFTIEIVDRLTELGIPVQGHVGLTPQHIPQRGGAFVQGRDHEYSAPGNELVETAVRLEEAGAFSIIIEAVTEAVGRDITEAVDVPTIGIGAGRHVDGQVLVINDVLGLNPEPYSLSKTYTNLGEEIKTAVNAYVDDVRSGAFPASEHVFDPIE